MAEGKWWPTLEEYNPNISEEKWLELLNNEEIFNYKSMCMMRRFVDYGGAATCTDLSSKYGGTVTSYIGIEQGLGKRIQKALNLKLCKDSDGREYLFTIPFLGIHVNKTVDENDGDYIWKLRPELETALSKIDLSKYELYEKSKLLELIEKYKIFFRSNSKAAFLDEEYKWKLITENQNKSENEIALAVSKENITDIQRVAPAVSKLVSDNPEELSTAIKHLFTEDKELLQRLLDFKNDIKNICADKDFKVLPNDERTASALLACHNPTKYTFYMDTKAYEPLCEYLEIKKQSAGEKYIHFLDILYEFEKYVKEDAELLGLLEPFTSSYEQSTLLIAQNIIYVLNAYGFLRKRKYWIVKVTNDDYWYGCKDNNYWCAQQRYGIQDTAAVSNFLKQISFVNNNDVLFLAYTNVIYAYGIVKDCLLETEQISSIKKVLADKSHEFNSGVVRFSDSDVFYEDLTKGEESWGQRINVDKWHCYDEQSAITTSGVNNAITSGVASMSIFGITTEYGELKMKELEDQEQNKASEAVKLLKLKKNIILQGAPGTGKTYTTAEIALSILGKDVSQYSNHKELMKAYEDLLINIEDGENSKGQIGFVTFHQSMDYEDFVEGIKPETDGSGSVNYNIEDGIFKLIAKKAAKSEDTQSDNFEESWKKLIEIFSEKETLTIPTLSENTSFDIELNEFGNGLATRTYKEGSSDWTRGKSRFFNKKQLENIYRGLPGIPSGGHDNYRKAIIKYMLDPANNIGLVKYKPTEASAETKPYVLIIDEINRGNVSKIFGELITLLESDKRIGGEHPLSVILPYSKDRFSVPSNLYIIGTMNTTDRSVGTIDYAVRRRFSFITLEANKDIVVKECGENSLSAQLFDAVKSFLEKNKIEMDIEDLMVGHSYFLVKDENELSIKWKYDILPLLCEYIKDGIIRGDFNKKTSIDEFIEANKEHDE